ncbi:hypothetical protein RI367_005949 [Sorochytrium milnesiophthora]
MQPVEIAIPPGIEHSFRLLYEVVHLPLLHAHLFDALCIDCPRGVLLYGPPGTGKTFVVATVARALAAELVTISGPEVLSPFVGESERNLRERFREAEEIAATTDAYGRPRPVILLIDEIDALAPKRSASSQQQASSRVVAQLLTLMDGMVSGSGARAQRVVVVATTNRPNAVDAALRRPGRFDREIAMDPPDAATRERILRSLTKDMPLSHAMNKHFATLAECTPAYVGADLAALVTPADFALALKRVPPSMRKEYALDNVKELTWNDVAGVEGVKLRLQQAVVWPMEHKDTFARLGLRPPRGVLMYGPPGCSKTTLARVLASSMSASFFSLSGAQIYSAYVGEAERTVRTLFHRARQSTPSILFIDELDALVGTRDRESGDPTQERVLSTLLNEMDGVESAANILVVAATNRPDMIDKALLRPGRFDVMLYVEPPDAAARKQIFGLYTSRMPLSPSMDLHSLAERTALCTGADVENICREAALYAMRRAQQSSADFAQPDCVTMDDFSLALASVRPSLDEETLQRYTALASEYGSGV